MKIALVYPIPCDALEVFTSDILRFARTLACNPPAQPFVLVPVLSTYRDDTAKAAWRWVVGAMGESVAHNSLAYSGQGCDIGSHQHAAHAIDADLMVCFSTRVHFHRAGWLKRIVESWEAQGKNGIGAAMASCERHPHLRTCCYWMSPELFRSYPYLVNSREKTFMFESGEWNISRWVTEMKLPVRMATWDASYSEPAWRTPPNIYRRGDQSNCLVWDRHTDIYAAATPERKRELERYAGDK